MKVLKIFFVVIPLLFSFSIQAQWLQISENRRFLIKEDSPPFFWLGIDGAAQNVERIGSPMRL